MQRSGRVLILLGILLGGLALIASFVFLNPDRNRAQVEVQTTKVVVARRAIAPRATVTTDTIGLADWPTASVPRGALTDPVDAYNRLAATQIAEGQVILPGMLIDKEIEETRRGAGSQASYIVPNGLVAMAYAIDAVSGVASALREGDHVDVLASYDVASTGNITTGVTRRQITQIALQDVEVLKVGLWSASAEAGAQSYVTFLLTPQDALTLKFLRETSSGLHLVLRAAGDHQRFRTQPIVVEYVDIRFGFNGMLVK
ncbi:MAG: Flp pilus assembly protein CpaB [Chloroflexi bacterium]|nr:Flp pilus assembly protein CpaB [Chloroflexota bacterium]